jgi:hypothetical protein
MTNHSDGSLGEAGAVLAASLLLGTPAAESGDPAGAFQLYSCAARLILATSNGNKRLHDRVAKALKQAKAQEEPDEQAERLREEFAGIVGDARRLDEEDPLTRIQAYLALAISIGAPAYNLGDRRGCYDVYSCTARMVLATIDEGAPEARSRLERALEECEGLDDDNEKAWAMRHGFDEVGDMQDRPTVTGDEVRRQLALAIRLGAPAYNAGDHRGCYEVYACTARLLLGALDAEEGAGKLLADALKRAALLSNVTDQAWAMREAFDAILGDAADEEEESAEERDEESEDGEV